MIPDPITPAWLRARLAAAGVSQREAARILGVNERSMRKWCCGERTPRREMILVLDARLSLLRDDERRALETVRDKRLTKD